MLEEGQEQGGSEGTREGLCHPWLLAIVRGAEASVFPTGNRAQMFSLLPLLDQELTLEKAFMHQKRRKGVGVGVGKG